MMEWPPTHVRPSDWKPDRANLLLRRQYAAGVAVEQERLHLEAQDETGGRQTPLATTFTAFASEAPVLAAWREDEKQEAAAAFIIAVAQARALQEQIMQQVALEKPETVVAKKGSGLWNKYYEYETDDEQTDTPVITPPRGRTRRSQIVLEAGPSAMPGPVKQALGRARGRTNSTASTDPHSVTTPSTSSVFNASEIAARSASSEASDLLNADSSNLSNAEEVDVHLPLRSLSPPAADPSAHKGLQQGQEAGLDKSQLADTQSLPVSVRDLSAPAAVDSPVQCVRVAPVRRPSEHKQQMAKNAQEPSDESLDLGAAVPHRHTGSLSDALTTSALAVSAIARKDLRTDCAGGPEQKAGEKINDTPSPARHSPPLPLTPRRTPTSVSPCVNAVASTSALLRDRPSPIRKRVRRPSTQSPSSASAKSDGTRSSDSFVRLARSSSPAVMPTFNPPAETAETVADKGKGRAESKLSPPEPSSSSIAVSTPVTPARPVLARLGSDEHNAIDVETHVSPSKVQRQSAAPSTPSSASSSARKRSAFSRIPANTPIVDLTDVDLPRPPLRDCHLPRNPVITVIDD